MTSTKKSETYEVVAGTRTDPGQTLATFSGSYKCGGPATACLRYFAKASRSGAPMFFRKVH